MDLSERNLRAYKNLETRGEVVAQRMISFADDTTLVTRRKDLLVHKAKITAILPDCKEKVHPAKWQVLKVETATPLNTEKSTAEEISRYMKRERYARPTRLVKKTSGRNKQRNRRLR